MAVLYTAKARSEGGRAGHVRSSDGLLETDLAMPKSMGGNGNATNPEQLFAAGYAACFASSVEFLAHRDGIKTGPVAVDSTVTMRSTEAGPFVLDVALHVTIADLPQADAEQLVQAAHAVCPYSNAVQGNVDVQLSTEAK